MITHFISVDFQSSILGKQLIEKLKQLCASKKDDGHLSFECAICLGCMGVRAPVAKLKLMKCLETKDTNLVCKVSNITEV